MTIAAADLNGDRIPDLVVTGGSSGATSVLLGNGNGTFQSGLQIFAAPLQAIAAADFNEDGSPDIAGGLISIGVAAFLNLTPAPPPLTVVPAPTFLPGPLTPNSFAAAFGTGLTNLTPRLVSP